MISDKQRARLAGLSFLAVIGFGVFAEFYVRQQIYVFNDPAATANNIAEYSSLYTLGIVSDLMMALAYFLFPLILHPLFLSVNKNLLRLMILSVSVAVTILCLNSINQIAALEMVNGSDYLGALSADQRDGWSTFFLKLHGKGYKIAQIFYGLYLLPLGYLIYKSGRIPKIIGVFLMLGFVGDFIDYFWYFLFPDFDSILLANITLPADLGEFSLCLWLLVMGIRPPKTVEAVS
ncbi:DUF4386 domain-containing protein [Poritiphilus flavus]|uniref:DUF4386 family protein n=1 Tax=Poritiphilus flavus TaxID=2697053 RepID=A0A6L9EBH3_9FLAO|nr:DUF4386 domain-containing protein [Poritiphilus flavus]NAS12003.1 DUF4386 family protein [Poritiphilus flavus]